MAEATQLLLLLPQVIVDIAVDDIVVVAMLDITLVVDDDVGEEETQWLLPSLQEVADVVVFRKYKAASAD